MVLGTSRRIISLSKKEPDIMSESNKCCEKCNDMQGDQSCEDTTCPCHSPTDTRTSDVESVIEAYFEARAKKWEKYGINWNSDDDREWWRQALTSFREEAVAEERERILKWSIEEVELILIQMKTETDREVYEYLAGKRNQLYDLQRFISKPNS